MATFVCVHGGWGGGWEWRRVARLLQARGHEVFTPTLTGLGERAHLTTPDVGLDTHIADVVALMECEDLTDVVLSGHSYGGMVITGVIDRVPDRIKHAVYVDAMLPNNGEAVADIVGADLFDDLIRGPAEETKDGWLVPYPFGSEEFLMTAEDAAWYFPKLVPQPLRSLEQPLTLQRSPASAPSATYIQCLRSETEAIFAPLVRRAQERGWRHRQLESGHDVHIIKPEQVAAFLEEAATADD